VVGDGLLGLLDAAPGIRSLLELRVGRHQTPQSPLIAHLLLHQGWIQDSGKFSPESFSAVLHSEKIVFSATRVLRASGAECAERHLEVVQPLEAHRAGGDPADIQAQPR